MVDVVVAVVVGPGCDRPPVIGHTDVNLGGIEMLDRAHVAYRDPLAVAAPTELGREGVAIIQPLAPSHEQVARIERSSHLRFDIDA